MKLKYRVNWDNYCWQELDSFEDARAEANRLKGLYPAQVIFVERVTIVEIYRAEGIRGKTD